MEDADPSLERHGFHDVTEHQRDPDLLVVSQVAQRYSVSARSVERWIAQGLPARKATLAEIALLFGQGILKGTPPTGVWVIREADLHWIARIRKPAGHPTRQKQS